MEEISLVNIINWVISLSIAATVFILYRIKQLQVIKGQKEIARHQIIRLFRDDISQLFSSNLAYVIEDKTGNLKELRNVLDNIPNWEFKHSTTEKTSNWERAIYIDHDNSRFWLVRDYTKNEISVKQYLKSQAFQESLLWFRSLKKAFDAEIIKREDLGDLWRSILPYGFSGRLTYFKKYFQGEKEIYSIVFVINETLKYFIESDDTWFRPIQYFNEYATEEEKELLFKHLDKRDILKINNIGK